VRELRAEKSGAFLFKEGLNRRERGEGAEDAKEKFLSFTGCNNKGGDERLVLFIQGN
jgi:hypothetical protein